MSYDFRDFIFDLSKESIKQNQQNAIRQQCMAMRQRATLLTEKDREIALRIIDEYERKQMQNVERQATNASIVKEVLKQFEL